jgi:hypothetical protein
MKIHACGIVTVLFVAVSALLYGAGEQQQPEPTPLPEWNTLQPLDIKDLEKTNISGLFAAQIQEGTNQVFCASYGIVAQEFIDAFPSLLILAGEDKFQALLDPEIAYDNLLAEENVFTRAGTVNETELERLDKDLLDRFPRAEPFSPDLRDYLLYSVVYFDKKLPWKVVFHGDLGISFGVDHTPVQAFGFSTFLPDFDAYREMAKQVTIHYMDQPRQPSEIVLSLHPESATDEVIIGMVEPRGTLRQTYDYVLRRIADSKSEYEFDYNSRLAIPKINFNIHDHIPRSGTIVAQVPNLGISGPLDGEMRVAMSLDERGASAFSRGYLGITSVGITAIIDKPFLVAFREVGSELPYLASWIDNAELLVPRK